jgi:hypothetical protein
MVQLIDQQGVATTVTLNAYSFGYIVLTIADGIYAEIPWSEFRRAYKTEGNFIVTTADGQELKGQLDSDQNDLKDENGKTLDIQSLSSIVMIGLDSFWLKESSRPVKNTLPGHPWQLHITEPEDLTFIVTQPEFAFEYLATTHDPVFGDTTETAVGLTEAFTLELGGISHHLSSLQEFRKDTASQITIIQANAMETTGGFFPILSLMGHIYKGSTPAWYLRALWVDYRISIEVKNPRWVLTK